MYVLCISKYPNYKDKSKFLIKFWNGCTKDTPNFLCIIWAFNLINVSIPEKAVVYFAQFVVRQWLFYCRAST